LNFYADVNTTIRIGNLIVANQVNSSDLGGVSANEFHEHIQESGGKFGDVFVGHLARESRSQSKGEMSFTFSFARV
jgi:hypothetical protein